MPEPKCQYLYLVLSLPTNGRHATKALYSHYQQLVVAVQTSRSVAWDATPTIASLAWERNKK